MREVIKWLLPLVSAPGSLLLLRFVNAFDLRPFAIWTIPASILSVVVSIGGAFLARFSDRNMSKRKRRVRFVVALCMMLVLAFIYDWLYRTPPPERFVTVYDASAYFCYFATHFAYGFCVAEIAVILVDSEK